MFYVIQQKVQAKKPRMKANYFKHCIINAKSFIELGVILLGCVLASYAARYFWLADLFSHFVFQYVLGAIVFTIIFIVLKKWKALLLPALTLLLCLPKLSYLENSRSIYSDETKPTYNIVHFNKLVTNKAIDDIEQWIRSLDPQPHTIVLHEASYNDLKLADALSDLFPYQIRKPREHAFGTIILNTTPFDSVETINITGVPMDNFALKAKFSVEGINNNITLYALHATPPMNHTRWSQRNIELEQISTLIGQDTADHIIFTGDWNITPYSPFFNDTLNASGLKIAREPVFAKATWPDFGKIAGFSLLQIPIDHILFSSALTPTFKKVEKPLGSDHHPTIMHFAER